MTNTTTPPRLFDRTLIRAHRARSAARFGEHDFLHQRVMADLVDRLETVTRDFPLALFHGAGPLVDSLTPACGVGAVITSDLAAPRLGPQNGDQNPQRLVFDEEALPFAPHAVDLVVSVLTLHSVNDIIGTLIQYRNILKPDGLLLAAIFSGDTLAGPKRSFLEVETTLRNGAASRFYPFADVRQWGNAVSRAGFKLPVTDVDRIDVRYQHPLKLFADLRGIGETNGLAGESSPLSKQVFAAALNDMATNNQPVTFDITYLTAWAPHPDQPKPLKPGSAKMSLAQALKQTS